MPDLEDYECDYCFAMLPPKFRMRALGFTAEGLPLVKTWCGECQPSDEEDPSASVALERWAQAIKNGADYA